MLQESGKDRQGETEGFMIDWINADFEKTIRDFDYTRLAQKGGRGECYIMSNEVVTMHDMFRLMNEAAGLSRRFHVLSKRLAHIGVKVLALAAWFTGEEPLLSEFNIYMLNRNNEFDCSKAQRELGFHCRPFSESVRDTVAWLREEGFLDTVGGLMDQAA